MGGDRTTYEKFRLTHFFHRHDSPFAKTILLKGLMVNDYPILFEKISRACD